jgi:hypothetical protein
MEYWTVKRAGAVFIAGHADCKQACRATGQCAMCEDYVVCIRNMSGSSITIQHKVCMRCITLLLVFINLSLVLVAIY